RTKRMCGKEGEGRQGSRDQEARDGVTRVRRAKGLPTPSRDAQCQVGEDHGSRDQRDRVGNGILFLCVFTSPVYPSYSTTSFSRTEEMPPHLLAPERATVWQVSIGRYLACGMV